MGRLRIAYIALGGAIGALARWRIALALPAASGLPLGILVINLSGCLLLGLLSAHRGRAPGHPDLRIGLATGFCGGYTTFSTWEGGMYALVTGRHLGLAAVYLGASLVGGALCMMAGRRLGVLLSVAD